MTAALERATARGELTPGQLKWALAQLSGRPRRADAVPERGDRRQEVLRVATRVFLRRGYRRATIEEVASELSLTKAGVYHYFRSKEEILEAICGNALAASERVILESLRGPGDAADRLRRLAQRYTELVMGDEALLVLSRHYDEVSEVAQAQILKRRRRLLSLLRGVLEEGVVEGVFDIGDTGLAVACLFGMLSWLWTWYEPKGPVSPEGVRDALVRQLMHGVSADGDGQAGTG